MTQSTREERAALREQEMIWLSFKRKYAQMSMEELLAEMQHRVSDAEENASGEM